MSTKTRICFVVDDSWSISGAGIQRDLQNAMNVQLSDISEEAAKSGDDVAVTMYLFGEKITQEFSNVPAKHLGGLKSYSPNQGLTRLFEATATAIKEMERIDKKEGGSDTAFLIVVITDGHNNDLRYTPTQFKKDIDRVQQTGRFTLVFMLPPGERRSFCRQFGISEGNVTEWETSKKGVTRSAQVQRQGLKNYFAGRRTGSLSTSSFYSDMSHVSSADVKAVLDDISAQCNVWTVWKDERIDDFCSKMSGKSYIKGAAFYQLTKTEKAVQDYKGILIMEKGKSAIYAGDAARQMLGLPNYSVKLIPGDHANFEIFIQSTSMNRKLPANTKVIYYPGAV